MTISKELFLAIFSMDSYNRGDGAGISDGDANDPDGLGGLQSQIGNATVINQNISPEAQAAGFYAIAYEWNGETIISYRGTDNFPGEIFLTDIPIFRVTTMKRKSIWLPNSTTAWLLPRVPIQRLP